MISPSYHIYSKSFLVNITIASDKLGICVLQFRIVMERKFSHWSVSDFFLKLFLKVREVYQGAGVDGAHF